MLLKVSFEAPPGVKRNLQRTYEAWGPPLMARATPLQAQLLFMLAWFHAVVQERRNYMPQASLFPSMLLVFRYCLLVFATRYGFAHVAQLSQLLYKKQDDPATIYGHGRQG